jgi:hypothetical protein
MTHVLILSGIPEFGQDSAYSIEKKVKLSFQQAMAPKKMVSYSSVCGRELNNVNARKALTKIVNSLDDVSSEVIIIYYIGHGDQKRDLNGDETDGMDEYWRFYGGGILTDDDLTTILSKSRTNPFIFVISDCCSSGSMIDKQGDRFTNWATLGACTDAQSAFAGKEGGMFTLFGLIPALREGANTPQKIKNFIDQRLQIQTQTVTLVFGSEEAATRRLF